MIGVIAKIKTLRELAERAFPVRWFQHSDQAISYVPLSGGLDPAAAAKRQGAFIDFTQPELVIELCQQVIDEDLQMRKALRSLAIAEVHRMAEGGGTVHVGHRCNLCNGEWTLGNPEQHSEECRAVILP